MTAKGTIIVVYTAASFKARETSSAIQQQINTGQGPIESNCFID